MPFDGINSNSVVIMDNASINHVDGVVSMIGEVGALVHFLPPYSPDYAPIEECFSKVKAMMRRMEMEAQVIDIETIALSAFSCITHKLDWDFRNIQQLIACNSYLAIIIIATSSLQLSNSV